MVAVPGRPWRFIPSQYPPVAAFDSVATPDDLAPVMELEGWTNDRLVLERIRRLPEHEWVYGRANASVVMAAFLHGAPDGTRFTGPELGAWYAAFEQATAVAEVAHHALRDAVNRGRSAFTGTYRAYAATLLGDYDGLRGMRERRPDLFDPNSYASSQCYGEARRAAGADGIVYDSVRRRGGTSVVAYRPTNVTDVAQGDHWRITVSLDAPPVARRLRANAP